MAGPQWKIYDASGAYQAACKEPEAAAAVVALYGEGAKIKNGHSTVVWHEGHEEDSAGNSFDFCAKVCRQRLKMATRAAFIKQYGQEAYDQAIARA